MRMSSSIPSWSFFSLHHSSHQNFIHLSLIANTLRCRTTASPAFNGNNLVVKSPKVQTKWLPGIEVILNCHSSATSLRISDWYILIECCRAHNRRLVYTGILPHCVRWSIASDRPLYSARCREVWVTFNNVVLNKGVFGPAIDREQTCPAADTKRTAKFDRSIRSYCQQIIWNTGEILELTTWIQLSSQHRQRSHPECSS